MDTNNTRLETSRITAYTSQYGLQGKVFNRVAKYMNEDEIISNLNLLCCIATATVFVSIVLLIYAKYNSVLAGVFFVTFWLSPWVTNFARNLYWVEFTWFIPMAIGLLCAWKIDNRKYRIVSYMLTLITIMGKCLCGYEYISVVMMGLISFLLVDLILSLVKKDEQQAKLLFRTTLIIGVVALSGFILAICIHAPLKGDGSIMEGIKTIIKEDVLRRTKGGDLNDFAPVYWASFNASVWEVCCKYFHFPTEIIVGIKGNLFPILCVVPLSVWAYEYKFKKINIELVVMYIVFFLTSISWFCLAKSHSYIHTHMNYVLWYFGFVQICLYVIVNRMVELLKEIRLKGKVAD